MRFLILDGNIVEKKNVHLPDNFTGTGCHIMQHMWYGFGGIPLFTENLSMMKAQAATLHMPVPAEFSNERELFRLIKRMLNKNKLYRSGHIILQLAAGNSAVNSLVTCTAFGEFDFPFEEKGVLVDFSKQKKYSHNTISRMAFFSESLWQSALAEIQGTPYSRPVILNEKEMVCEGAYSNIFLVAGNKLVTPSFRSGCHENTIRRFVIEAAVNLGLKAEEKTSIPEEELFGADELFFASELKGIQWILGIGNQRFLHYYSKKIADELNALLKSRAVSYAL